MTTAAKKTYPQARQKVPPFARYKGTSAWRKYKAKVREYYAFRAAAEKAAEAG